MGGIVAGPIVWCIDLPPGDGSCFMSCLDRTQVCRPPVTRHTGKSHNLRMSISIFIDIDHVVDSGMCQIAGRSLADYIITMMGNKHIYRVKANNKIQVTRNSEGVYEIAKRQLGGIAILFRPWSLVHRWMAHPSKSRFHLYRALCLLKSLLLPLNLHRLEIYHPYCLLHLSPLTNHRGNVQVLGHCARF